MSYWKNDEEYQMKLVNFIERFVAHNTLVNLYSQKFEVNSEGIRYTVNDLLWSGMDWQITEDYSGSDYFKFHPDVLPCLYGECNVVKVTGLGLHEGTSDEISLVIDPVQVKTNKEFKKEETLEANVSGVWMTGK